MIDIHHALIEINPTYDFAIYFEEHKHTSFGREDIQDPIKIEYKGKPYWIDWRSIDPVPTTLELSQAADRAELKNLSVDIVKTRNAELVATDWIVSVVDSGVVNISDWVAYRQALRDITLQTGYPKTVVWPTKPIIIKK